jgi:hypothetical protein
MLRLLRQHLTQHGVTASAFSLRDDTAQLTSERESPAPAVPGVKDKYRTFIYPPKWEAFFVASMDSSVNDDALLSMIPNLEEEPTLHCDSGAALLSLAKQVAWKRTACAKHLEPNISGLNGTLKPLAMSLIYGREVSTHMAYEIRDRLLSSGCQTIGQQTRKWLQATFSTDAGMQVCVHKWSRTRTH